MVLRNLAVEYNVAIVGVRYSGVSVKRGSTVAGNVGGHQIWWFGPKPNVKNIQTWQWRLTAYYIITNIANVLRSVAVLSL